jgi:uncharacterized membrane protein YbhN (UPF0104 family)
VGLYALGTLLTALRWRATMRAVGGELGLGAAAAGVLAGFFVNNVTPSAGVGGDLFRIGFLGRRGVPLARATAAVALDRLTDGVLIGALVLAALPAIGCGVLSHLRLGIAGLVLVIGAIVLVRCGRGRLRAAAALVRGADRRGVAVAFALALGIWLQDLLRLKVVGAAFGVALTTSQAAALAVATLAGFAAPSVGGLGAVEGGVTAALVWFGVAPATALAIALAERAVSYVLATSVGGALVALMSIRGAWKWKRSPSSAIGISPASGE